MDSGIVYNLHSSPLDAAAQYYTVGLGECPFRKEKKKATKKMH